MTLETDEHLIQRVRDGDDRAFETLVARHQDQLARFIWRVVPNAADREEVCQDVFVKVYFKLDQFRGDAKFTTWMFQVAHRTAISRLRKKQLDRGEMVDEPVSPDRSLEAQADDPRIRIILDEALSSLKIEERSVVTLFYGQEMSIEDIAAVVDRPTGTVKSILHRVRSKLEHRLSKHPGISPGEEVA